MLQSDKRAWVGLIFLLIAASVFYSRFHHKAEFDEFDDVAGVMLVEVNEPPVRGFWYPSAIPAKITDMHKIGNEPNDANDYALSVVECDPNLLITAGIADDDWWKSTSISFQADDGSMIEIRRGEPNKLVCDGTESELWAAIYGCLAGPDANDVVTMDFAEVN